MTLIEEMAEKEAEAHRVSAPCRFCGCTFNLVTPVFEVSNDTDEVDSLSGFCVTCQAGECYAQGPIRPTISDAVGEWIKPSLTIQSD